MSNFLSQMPLSAWTGAITTYSGALSTLPLAEHSRLTFAQLGEIVAPENGPQVIAEKYRSRYFTPGHLKDAPLVGKTLARAIAAGGSLTGKQRSSGHMTTSKFIIYELDKSDRGQVDRITARLAVEGIGYILFTTWSIGLPDKPGHRVRVVVPVDAELDSAAYRPAWHGGNQAIFESAGDTTGDKLCQQQGCWSIGPDRLHHSERRIFFGGVVASKAILENAAPSNKPGSPQPRQTLSEPMSWDGPQPNLKQIVAAVAVMNPDDYAQWDKTVCLLIAISKGEGMVARTMLQIALDFENSGSEASKAKNTDQQYSTTARSAKWVPAITPTVAAASLFAMARDQAEKTYRQAVNTRNWVGARPAWGYLAAYHPRRWNDIRAELEIEA